MHRFTLDDSVGEFCYFGQLKIPEKPKTIYSCNEGNYSLWDKEIQEATDAFKAGPKPYSARYVGSMVSDVHRTLLYGGIFGYAADTKNKAGKLRLLYEAAPMAFLVEQAGGIATTGRDRIMDIEPSNVHQRVPCILGSADDVNELKSYYAKTDKSADIYQG